ncbi:hypothetical protein TNCV_169181 [Trichonephila clavipes]|nr:hypothetical protein TNCV_169181 [Trichonephila clavipes]
MKISAYDPSSFEPQASDKEGLHLNWPQHDKARLATSRFNICIVQTFQNLSFQNTDIKNASVPPKTHRLSRRILQDLGSESVTKGQYPISVKSPDEFILHCLEAPCYSNQQSNPLMRPRAIKRPKFHGPSYRLFSKGRRERVRRDHKLNPRV